MPKCIIICPLYQGECLSEVSPQPGDLLLCADAGYLPARRYGLMPDLVIGDFDTMPQQEADGQPVMQLPVHKDDTDLGVCIQQGRNRGYHDFLLVGCLGGRMDHSIAALQLMMDAAEHGEPMRILDAENDMTILSPGSHVLPKKEGRLLSLLAMTDQVTDVCLSGTEWPLEHAVLTNRYPLGISNRITAKEAKLSFTSGLLLVDHAVNKTCL